MWYIAPSKFEMLQEDSTGRLLNLDVAVPVLPCKRGLIRRFRVIAVAHHYYYGLLPGPRPHHFTTIGLSVRFTSPLPCHQRQDNTYIIVPSLLSA